MKIVSWSCEKDLTPFVDSMLFNSGTPICGMTLETNGAKIALDLVVTGAVSVTYKGEIYHSPDDFPEDLRKKIETHPGDFSVYAPSGEGGDNEEGDCYVSLNNWFAMKFEITTSDGNSFMDDECYESDISKETPDELKDEMYSFAEELCKRYHLS